MPKLKINGNRIDFNPGQTVLEAARAHHIAIPTLCHMKNTSPTGKCGICVVEIQGSRDLQTACTLPAETGIIVWTDSKKVIKTRRIAIERLLASGNHTCAAGSPSSQDWSRLQQQNIKREQSTALCPAWGDCELQDLAYQYQADPSRFPKTIANPYLETVNPMIVRDMSRCIVCEKCVKACNEIQVNRAIRLEGEDRPRVVAGDDLTLLDSDCVFCGECVQVCPVGALTEKKSRDQRQPWEEVKIRTTCPYCGVGCQQWLHVKDRKIVRVTGVEHGSPNKGRLCVKGRFGYDFIYSRERLKTPLIRENGSFREASWDEAVTLVADRFKGIIETHGPDAVAGVSCARSINEDSYQMQKLFRAVFGTNNIDHCART